jgi:hypothetical protein
MVKNVAGVYDSIDKALNVVDELVADGIDSEKIHIVGDIEKSHPISAGLVGKEVPLSAVPESLLKKSVPEDVYQSWQQHVSEGRKLVLVTIPADIEPSVTEILKRHDPIEVR